jgi:hypothetical protein
MDVKSNINIGIGDYYFKFWFQHIDHVIFLFNIFITTD